MEGHEEKLKFFARENSIDASELEQALLYLRQQSSNKQNWKGGKLSKSASSSSYHKPRAENGSRNIAAKAFSNQSRIPKSNWGIQETFGYASSTNTQM
jgi:hypothetical protein